MESERYRINRSLVSFWVSTFTGLDIPYRLDKEGYLQKKGILELIRSRFRFIKYTKYLREVLILVSHFLRKLGFLKKK